MEENEDKVEEYADVIKRRGRQTTHFGRLFAVLVEKNSELHENHKDRMFKGRVVFDGSDVKDQDKDVALFQDLSSCPATMHASKAADTYGLFPGHITMQADARQAYTQCTLKVTETYVRLPYEAWPEEWKKRNMWDPVCHV